jgi:hypothetical protein
MVGYALGRAIIDVMVMIDIFAKEVRQCTFRLAWSSGADLRL